MKKTNLRTLRKIELKLFFSSVLKRSFFDVVIRIIKIFVRFIKLNQLIKTMPRSINGAVSISDPRVLSILSPHFFASSFSLRAKQALYMYAELQLAIFHSICGSGRACRTFCYCSKASAYFFIMKFVSFFYKRCKYYSCVYSLAIANKPPHL